MIPTLILRLPLLVLFYLEKGSRGRLFRSLVSGPPAAKPCILIQLPYIVCRTL